MLAMDSEDWDREEEKYKVWKKSGGVWPAEFHPPEAADNPALKKKPKWLLFAACGTRQGPVEICRGWSNPEEMFYAMRCCNEGLIYKPQEDLSFDASIEISPDNYAKITKKMQFYAKLGSLHNAKGKGWPSVGIIKYKAPGKNQVKVFCLRFSDDNKSNSGPNGYKKKGAKMDITGFSTKLHGWRGFHGTKLEIGPDDLRLETLINAYNRHDRQ